MRYSTFVLFLLLLASCELVTEIDIPEEDARKVVVNCVFTPDSTWMISISTSTPIQDFNHAILEPHVTLTDETGQEIPLIMDDPFLPPGQAIFGRPVAGERRFRGATRPISGMSYRIEVSGINVPSVAAHSRTPTLVQLIDAKLDSANAVVGNDEYNLAIPIEFTFEDPAGQGDYYFPILTAHSESQFTNPVTGQVVVFKSVRSFPLGKSPSTSDIFDDDQQVRAMPDNGFDGKRHTASLYVLSYRGRPDEKLDSVRLYLSHTKEEYFRYFQSERLYEESRGNPFAEPVQVYTNVEGGLGIFAGSTSSYWDFK